jgi:hypothetical protein
VLAQNKIQDQLGLIEQRAQLMMDLKSYSDAERLYRYNTPHWCSLVIDQSVFVMQRGCLPEWAWVAHKRNRHESLA